MSASTNKTIEQAEEELNINIAASSKRYVELITSTIIDGDKEKVEQEKKDLKRRLNEMKAELKFIQGMKGKVDKKAQKDLEKQQKDLVRWVKKMPNSISGIVKSIPKS